MSITHERVDTFQAYVTVAGTHVSLVATTIDGLLKTLAQLGHTSAAPTVEKPKAEAPRQTVREEADKAASAAASTVKAAVDAVKPAEPKVEAPKHDYGEIKAAVLALAKVNQEVAKATLAQFTGESGAPVDHGNKLKLEDYAAFLAAAKVALDAAAKVPA